MPWPAGCGAKLLFLLTIQPNIFANYPTYGKPQVKNVSTYSDLFELRLTKPKTTPVIWRDDLHQAQCTLEHRGRTLKAAVQSRAFATFPGSLPFPQSDRSQWWHDDEGLCGRSQFGPILRPGTPPSPALYRRNPWTQKSPVVSRY